MTKDAFSQSPGNDASTFDVMFEPPSTARQFGLYRNDFRFVGRGRITVDAGTLYVLARSQLWPLAASTYKQLEVPISEIRRVEVDGNALRIEAAPAQSRTRTTAIWLNDASSAQSLAGRISTSPVAADGRMYQVPRGTRPLITCLLAIACIFVFALLLARGAGWNEINNGALIALGSNFGPYTVDGEWWRLFTAPFAHLGVIHLLVNLWALLAFGITAERIFGAPRFAFVVIASIWLGNVAGIWWNPNANYAGISGVVFGILGSIVSAGALSPSPAVRAAIRPIMNSALILTVALLATGLKDQTSGIAIHLGGLLAGLLFGPIVMVPSMKPVREAASFGTLIVLLACAGIWLLGDSPRRLDGMGRYWNALHWFGRNEQRATDNWESVVRSARSGSSEDLQLANRLESGVLPFWTEASARLGMIAFPIDASSKQQLDYLGEIASRRESAIQLCIRGLRAHDVGDVKRCNQAMADTDDFIRNSELSRPGK